MACGVKSAKVETPHFQLRAHSANFNAIYGHDSRRGGFVLLILRPAVAGQDLCSTIEHATDWRRERQNNRHQLVQIVQRNAWKLF